MTTRKLYHYQVYMPAMRLPAQIRLAYSKHAQCAAKDDRYGPILRLPEVLNVRTALLVEYEERNGMPYKLLFRVPYDARADLVVAVGVGGIVLTVWLNRKSDAHKTLDITRYCQSA